MPPPRLDLYLNHVFIEGLNEIDLMEMAQTRMH
jgi:hypothetical protein